MLPGQYKQCNEERWFSNSSNTYIYYVQLLKVSEPQRNAYNTNNPLHKSSGVQTDNRQLARGNRNLQKTGSHGGKIKFRQLKPWKLNFNDILNSIIDENYYRPQKKNKAHFCE